MQKLLTFFLAKIGVFMYSTFKILTSHNMLLVLTKWALVFRINMVYVIFFEKTKVMRTETIITNGGQLQNTPK